MEELLKGQTDYKYSLLIDNIFTAWKIAFLVNNIQEETTIAGSAFAPFAYATQHKNVEYIDITLDGNIDPRMLQKAQSHSAFVLHHFPTVPFKYSDTETCIIEDLTLMLGKPTNRDAMPDTAVIDFEELLNIKAAALLFDDEEKYNKAVNLASDGSVQKKFWNFDLTFTSFNATLEPSYTPILKKAFTEFFSEYKIRKEKAKALHQLSLEHKLLQSTPFDECNSFIFYPLFLIPSLYCPKEEIYADLIKHGLDVKVHYKPIYKLSALKQELSLYVTEDLYKAELSISLLTEHTKEEMVDIIEKVLEEYRLGGCSF